jgi:hypothetical protein
MAGKLRTSWRRDSRGRLSPEEKNRGRWIKVDPEDLVKPGETVQ